MPCSLKNKKILITCGPTWIPLDPVRVLSNISTGEMGHRIAQECLNKKARVTLLEGPAEKSLKSKKINILKFKYYSELFALLKQQLKNNFDVVIHLAAVSDYQLKNPQQKKISSQLKFLTLKLTPTKKIINHIKKLNKNVFLVGFKLESSLSKLDIKRLTKKLFKEAHCDLVVVNSVAYNKYLAYIIDKNKKVVAESKNKGLLSKQLIRNIENRL